ncbi:MAG: HNH endonuclease [Parcubacteria group bacterium]|nr:HNH endonuclease [Parcubacteria group bacterium]
MNQKQNFKSNIDKAILEVKIIKSEGIKKWRSWRKLRKAVIQNQPYCAVCGWGKKLEGHHTKPRHLFPELSLTMSNIIILCRDCHFHLGHWCNFVDDYNTEIVKISKILTETRLLQQYYNSKGGGK